MSGYKTIVTVLSDYAKTYPDQPAYHFLKDNNFDVLTYSELDKNAKSLAAFLQQCSCEGERVVLLLPPGLDYITAFFGCLYAKMIVVPAYPAHNSRHTKRVSAIIGDAKARFVLTNTKYLEYSPATEFVINIDKIDRNVCGDYKVPDIQPDDLAFLQYTSGSTGDPKGVMVSHKNIMVNVYNIDEAMGQYIGRGSMWLPPYHDMGLIGGVFYCLYRRTKIFLMSPTQFIQSPLTWLEILSREKLHCGVAPNFAYDLCVDKITDEQLATLNLSHWQCAMNGAEQVRYKTMERFYQRFKQAGFSKDAFFPVYGMAETTLMVSSAKEKPWHQPLWVSKKEFAQGDIITTSEEASDTSISLVSCGRAPKNHHILIADPGTNNLLPENRVGEILVNGPSVAMGYWDKPELSAKTFHVQTSRDSQGHLRTGDLGFISNGELYVTGRIKDVLIIRGVNHYAHDLEQTVMHAHPALCANATAVFSLESNGVENVIILQEVKRHCLAKLDAGNIIQHIRESMLANHGLQVEHIVLLKPLHISKTSSGKIQRWLCREKFINNDFEAVHHWSADHLNSRLPQNAASTKNSQVIMNISIFNNIAKWLAQRFQMLEKNITPEHSLMEFGIDSIHATELVGYLHSQFNIELDVADVMTQSSIASLVQLVQNRLAVLNASPISIAEKLQRFPLVKPVESLSPLFSSIQPLLFSVNDGISRDTTVIDGKSYINFAGYNYLGFSGDPYVTEAVIAAVKKYGTSASASRLASGEKPIHRQLEQAIADLIGVEDCLVYSSGHATNVSVITHLFGKGDLILHDGLIHNSILQGAIFSGATRLSYPHNDYKTIETLLEKNRHIYNRVLIVTEGVFSMDGDIPDVPQLIKLKKRFHTFLMIDEAHSMGVLGLTGRGVREHFNLQSQDVDIWMGTLSKSFASCGGYIAGSRELIENLKYNASGFFYSAGISPSNTAAAFSAIQLMLREPERVSVLHKNYRLFLTKLKSIGILTGTSYETPIIPIMTGGEINAIKLSHDLKNKGIFAMPILYPAVEKGQARVRLFINCLHTEEQIYFTVKALKSCSYLFEKEEFSSYVSTSS